MDNAAAIKLSRNAELHDRIKHIAPKHYFLREMVTARIIFTDYVRSKDNLADIFTTPLLKDAFQGSVSQLATASNNMKTDTI